jgi:hypothetical protein
MYLHKYRVALQKTAKLKAMNDGMDQTLLEEEIEVTISA